MELKRPKPDAKFADYLVDTYVEENDIVMFSLDVWTTASINTCLTINVYE